MFSLGRVARRVACACADHQSARITRTFLESAEKNIANNNKLKAQIKKFGIGHNSSILDPQIEENKTHINICEM